MSRMSGHDVPTSASADTGVELPQPAPSVPIEADESLGSDDDVVSLNQVISEEEQLERDVLAVLGPADAEHCSYSKGYVKRQPLYSCRTCAEATAGGPGGVCLACSLACHDGHDIVELYTKRKFRCDCGNSKFPSLCKLTEPKESQNDANKYDETFRGLYCTCHRPYPDEGQANTSEMLQCVICEDWFHKDHLELPPDSPEEFSEVTCRACMSRCGFLQLYATDIAQPHTAPPDHAHSTMSAEDESGKRPSDVTDVQTGPSTKRVKLCAAGWTADPNWAHGQLWPDQWRAHLCNCSDCVALYEGCQSQFLLDAEDTVDHYESQAPAQSGPDIVSRGLAAFMATLDRRAQIEMLSGYNFLKEKLLDFLKSFADSDKVVENKDVEAFFEKLNAEKRDPSDIPQFCR